LYSRRIKYLFSISIRLSLSLYSSFTRYVRRNWKKHKAILYTGEIKLARTKNNEIHASDLHIRRMLGAAVVDVKSRARGLQNLRDVSYMLVESIHDIRIHLRCPER